jgi:DNA-binding GntR family transcriptional regulator
MCFLFKTNPYVFSDSNSMTEQTKKSKERLFDDLKQAVLTLELLPGSDLDEKSLSEKYGLSRTPLREVLRQLSALGITTIEKNRGARVSELSHTTLRDFFLTAPMIYSSILQLAVANATIHQIAELKAAQLMFRKAMSDGLPQDRALANNNFHDITGRMADNRYLLPSFQRLLIDHARIGMKFYEDKTPNDVEMLETSAAHHDQMIDAIEQRDDTAADRLAAEHWNLSRNQISRFVMPAALNDRLGKHPQLA